MRFLIEIKGDYACFTRPELKVERVSYDVPTPSAIQGVLKGIYWHPGMEWVIDKYYVLNPIKFVTIKRNEVSETVSSQKVKSVMQGNNGPLYLDTTSFIQQRSSTVLKDVHYVADVHIGMTDKANESDNIIKFNEIVKRRLDKGQCYYMPYLGTREFPANFKQWEGSEKIPAIQDTRDLGMMLYGMDFSDESNPMPTFFRASLNHGMVDLTNCEVYR